MPSSIRFCNARCPLISITIAPTIPSTVVAVMDITLVMVSVFITLSSRRSTPP